MSLTAIICQSSALAMRHRRWHATPLLDLQQRRCAQMPLMASLVSSEQAQQQRHDLRAIRDIVFALCMAFVIAPLLSQAAERPNDSGEVTAVKSEASSTTAVRLNFGNISINTGERRSSMNENQ